MATICNECVNNQGTLLCETKILYQQSVFRFSWKLRVSNRTSSTDRVVGNRYNFCFEGGEQLFSGREIKRLSRFAYLIDFNKKKICFGGMKCNHEQILLQWLS